MKTTLGATINVIGQKMIDLFTLGDVLSFSNVTGK